jgi:hypothetical protein
MNPEENNLVVERTMAPVFPDDDYEMKIIDIQNFDRPAFNNPDETTPSFKITFQSNYDPAGEGPWEFTWFVTKSLSSKSHLFKLAKAVLGKSFDEGSDSFDASLLLGKTVRLVLRTETSKMGRDYSKVETVLTAKEGKEK